MTNPANRPPHTTSTHRWRPDTTLHPPPQCATSDCRADATVHGWCTACAAVQLTAAGVIRRRARNLLDILATDTDLRHHKPARRWFNELDAAAEALSDALDA